MIFTVSRFIFCNDYMFLTRTADLTSLTFFILLHSFSISCTSCTMMPNLPVNSPSLLSMDKFRMLIARSSEMTLVM